MIPARRSGHGGAGTLRHGARRGTETRRAAHRQRCVLFGKVVGGTCRSGSVPGSPPSSGTIVSCGRNTSRSVAGGGVRCVYVQSELSPGSTPGRAAIIAAVVSSDVSGGVSSCEVLVILSGSRCAIRVYVEPARANITVIFHRSRATTNVRSHSKRE